MKTLAQLTLGSLLLMAGCHHFSSSGSASSAPPPTPAQASALNRLPTPVAVVFHRTHPDATPSLIRVRLFPDGTTHYQIIYLDANGQSQQANYFPNGQPVPPSQ